jgi:hypothetical protein
VLPAEVAELAQREGWASTAGNLEVGESSVRFVPSHPFVPGTAYLVVLGPMGRDGAAAGSRVGRLVRPEVSGEPTTSVLAVYPTASALPHNVLRCYVYFSAPMSEGFATRDLSLVDVATGRPLAGAFLGEPELWDPSRRRLTALFDPGRIKRGLVPHAETGYPLTEGHPVELVVAAAFPDAAGRPLVKPSRRRYEVGPPLGGRLDPRAWRLARPRRGSTEPVTLEADRPLDHALAARCLTVVGPEGRPVAGRSDLAAGERRWRFTPTIPWAARRYELRVGPELEDVSGNSVRRPFDRDLARVEDEPATTSPLTRAFVPAAPRASEASAAGSG